MNPDDIPATSLPSAQSLPVQPATQPQLENNNLGNKTHTNPFAIISVVLLLVVVGMGSYMFGTRNNRGSLSTQIENPSPSPLQATPTPKVTNPTANPSGLTSVLPSGWSYKNNKECGVKFAIPPKAKPYFIPTDPNGQPSVTNDVGSGRFWDFPRGGVYPNMLSKIMGSKEYKQAVTMFAAPEEASGYVASAVIVSCIPNSANLTNDKMLESLKAKLTEYNSDTGEKGMQASSYVIKSSNKANRWNNAVYDINVLEDNSSVSYTMFASPEYVYEVKVMGASDDSFVQETAQKIFDSLVFEK